MTSSTMPVYRIHFWMVGSSGPRVAIRSMIPFGMGGSASCCMSAGALLVLDFMAWDSLRALSFDAEKMLPSVDWLSTVDRLTLPLSGVLSLDLLLLWSWNLTLAPASSSRRPPPTPRSRTPPSPSTAVSGVS